MDSTITDEDLDAASARLVLGFRDEAGDGEPDLAVDGLSEPLLLRLFRALAGS